MVLPCVVLAGGLGTRLRPFTDQLPKAMVPVAGRPFVDWQLEQLVEQGVRDVVLCIGYRGQVLREHVGDGRAYGLRVTYVDEGDHLRGTAGALRLAVDGGAVDDAFYVLYGDSYLDLDLAAVEAAWRHSGLPALMTVLCNEDRLEPSNAVVAGGRVVFYEKGATHRPPQMRWIDYGMSVLTAAVVRELVPPQIPVDLATVMARLSCTGRLAAFEVGQRFYEVGSPAGLQELEAHLAGRAAGHR